MKTYKTKYDSVTALAELPYFEKDAGGRLVLADKSAAPIIDSHTHLSFTINPLNRIDLEKTHPRVLHSFREEGLAVDMSIYSGVNLTRVRRDGLFGDYVTAGLFASGPGMTFTAPNLLEEMTRMGVERSVLLAMDIPGTTRASEEHIEAAKKHPRLIPFCGVSPRSLHWEAHVERCLSLGARGLKYHPYINFMPPDHRFAIRLFKRWSHSGLPILFHTAHNGVEPALLRQFSNIEMYEKPLRALPEATFILGHAGMGFYKKAIAMAKSHGNTYLEIGGHPPDTLREIIDLFGSDRLLFGTDWPVYPLALPLAKVLIATENAPDVRRKILYENAARLYAETASAARAC